MGLKRNEKGFIFTLDAVFSLVIASVGISILLYASYTNTTAYGYPVGQAFNLLHNLVQSPQISNGTMYSSYLEYVQNTSIYNWPQFAHDGEQSSSAGYGPKAPELLYSFTAPTYILPAVSVSGGLAALAAGNSIYVINAATGAQDFVFTGSSAITQAPLIYKNWVYFANASNFVSEVSFANGNRAWSYNTVNAIYSQLSIVNGYLAFGTTNGFYLLDPFNGSAAAYATTNLPTQVPVYANGEYIVSTSSHSSQNYLYSYALTTNGLVGIWSAALSSLHSTAPVVLNSTVAVGSGTYIYIFGAGGNQLLKSNLNSQIMGIAAVNNVYYVETATGIYAYTVNGDSILFSVKTVTDLQNSTPSYGGSLLYTLVNGHLFQGYSTTQYKELWNITMPSNYLKLNYSNIALAYGNAYVPNGNTLYVFGSYKSQEGDSILKIISNMYLSGEGDFAQALLNNFYNISQTGIFLNNTYAPDLGVASFNSLKGSYVEEANGFPWMDNSAQHFTFSIWVNSTSSNGVIIDGLGQQSTTGSWDESLLELVNGIVYIRNGTICEPLGPIPKNGWSNIAVTYYGTGYKGYINGVLANTLVGNTIVPSGGSSEMYYPLGLGSSQNCGSGAYFNGSMLNYQIYNVSLSSSQIGQIYQAGAFGAAVSQIPPTLQLWLPLDGNSNDFSGLFNIGFSSNVAYVYNPYMPKSLSNAYQVSKASAPIYLTSNNINRLYNVSVVIWK